MGHGDIVCFREGCFGISSLGIDCHSVNSGDMMSQMKLALQHERGTRNVKLIAQGKTTLSLNLFVQDVFSLGTIKGARAIRMEDQLGSIEVGKLADLIIFDGTSPGIICASEQDPVAAVVLHSSVRDIDTVIVDGVIRKQNGKLLPTVINPSLPGVTIPRQTVGWSQVARELISSRQNINKALKESDADDPEALVQNFMKVMHLREDKFIKM
jgi:cytosine/adenosine deaminase-related metal-dependent hydrolase